MSESDDNCSSPSQHKLAMKKHMADHDVVPFWRPGSNEEEEDEEEVKLSILQSKDGQSGTPVELTSTTAIFSKFT